MAGSDLFLGCVNEDRQKAMLRHYSRPVEDDWVPQPTLTPDKRSEPLAICAFGDSLLIYQTIRTGMLVMKSRTIEVCKRTLDISKPWETIHGVAPVTLGSWPRGKTEKGPAKSALNTDVKIAALGIPGETQIRLCLFVSHRSGLVEVIS